ncbi:MAG: hypothetical protein MPJ24_03165 [Pirellulaceae bacterium]|nr:hypothetical protein [Pirellulaceae bacterium]
MSAQESQIHAKIAFAMAAKQLDATRLQGDAAVELIEVAANMGRSPHSGHKLDLIG